MNFASGTETQTCGKGKVSCQAIYSSIMPNIQHNLLDSTTFYQVYTYKKKFVSMIKLYFNIVICFYFNLCSLNICSSYVENFKFIKIPFSRFVHAIAQEVTDETEKRLQ